MDTQLKELANEIAQAVTAAVNDSLEKRLQGAFGDSEGRIKKHFDEVDTRSELRIKQHIDEFETRAELRMKMHFENLEDKVTMAADGYGATLERIERDLSELNTKFDTHFNDHNLVPRNHNERIVNLEERR